MSRREMKYGATIVFLTIVGLLVLGWSGKLLPPATSRTFNLPYSSEFLEVSRPRHFPPREIHTEACGLGMLLDWLCWSKDPTFRSAGKVGLTTLRQINGEAQFFAINSHFRNANFREELIVLMVDGKTMEFSMNNSEIAPASFSKPVPFARIERKFCFSFALRQTVPQDASGLICVDLEEGTSMVARINTNAFDGFKVVLDDAGARQTFCDGETSTERVFKFLSGGDC